MVKLLAIQDTAHPATDLQAGLQLHQPLLLVVTADAYQPVGQAGYGRQLFGADLGRVPARNQRGL